MAHDESEGVPMPANDPRTWDTSDDFLVCDCGSGDFWIKLDRATGFHHVICKKCEADHSMAIVS
jgi:hypothetical protein